jgi:hypothetical protein
VQRAPLAFGLTQRRAKTVPALSVERVRRTALEQKRREDRLEVDVRPILDADAAVLEHDPFTRLAAKRGEPLAREVRRGAAADRGRRLRCLPLSVREQLGASDERHNLRSCPRFVGVPPAAVRTKGGTEHTTSAPARDAASGTRRRGRAARCCSERGLAPYASSGFTRSLTRRGGAPTARASSRTPPRLPRGPPRARCWRWGTSARR